MADDEDGQGLTDKDITDRFAGIEAEQAKQGGTLDKILDALGKLTPGQPAPEGSPKQEAGSVAEQVRAELDRAKQEQAAADKEKGHADTIAGLRADVDKLREQPPAPPVRRIEHWMGHRR